MYEIATQYFIPNKLKDTRMHTHTRAQILSHAIHSCCCLIEFIAAGRHRRRRCLSVRVFVRRSYTN